MSVEDYGLRTRRQQYDWIPANAGKCINGEKEIWNYGYPSIMCMDDALSLLRFFFWFFFFSFVLVILAGVLWRIQREEELLLSVALEWHFAYVSEGNITTQHK